MQFKLVKFNHFVAITENHIFEVVAKNGGYQINELIKGDVSRKLTVHTTATIKEAQAHIWNKYGF